MLDIFSDISGGATFSHVLIELIAVLIMVASMYLITKYLIHDYRDRIHSAEKDIKKYRAEAEHFRRESLSFVEGLSQEIDRQFDLWHLTHAEKEIALLLIKGLPTRTISEFRHVSEKTVRQQSTSIYKKAMVAGRSELAAYFLEDLMLPTQSRA